MDSYKFGKGLTIIGGIGMALCLAWWLMFYSEVIRQAGTQSDHLGNFFVCLFADNFSCGLIKNGARFLGYTPYEPLGFWFAGVLTVLGALLCYSSERSRT